MFHVSFTKRIRPEEFEGGMHTEPEELEGRMYRLSLLARPFDGCTGLDAQPMSARCLRDRGRLPSDACECAEIATTAVTYAGLGYCCVCRARESWEITGVMGIGIESDRTEPNTRDGLRNRELRAVPSTKLPAAPGRGKLRHPSTRVTSCKSGRVPRTVKTPLTPPHSGV